MGKYLRRAWLMLCLIAIASGSVTTSLSRSEINQNRFDPDGSFWILGNPPKGFEDFSEISLNSRRRREFNSPGIRLNRGQLFRFRIIKTTRDTLDFTTVSVRGISYSFSGRFLKDGVFAAADLNEDTAVLEGTLTKLSKGQKVAEAKLKFSYFGGT